jgi:uncharacterized protein
MATLATVTQASLSQGITVRITDRQSRQQLSAGTLVCVSQGSDIFVCMVADIAMSPVPEQVQITVISSEQCLWREYIARYVCSITAHLEPWVMLDGQYRMRPICTVPDVTAQVRLLTGQEVAVLFGDVTAEPDRFFTIGSLPLAEIPIALDMVKFCERSNGIFGRTGTGKTFITRLVLAGMLRYTPYVTLIFDMHSEYATQARCEGAQGFVKGLKTLFPDKVAICTLDAAATVRRGAQPDLVIQLSYGDIHVDDIISLQQELALHPTACEAAYLLYMQYGSSWIEKLLHTDIQVRELAAIVGAHPESLTALHRKLSALKRLTCIQPTSTSTKSIDALMDYLAAGVSVVIEFGSYTTSFAYLLIANIITRRIHQQYVHMTEQFLSQSSRGAPPKKLMIVIEEAHKFLNPLNARQTIFGTIAREMRKYYVNLLIVDQRPSGIDDEILSQLGTRLVAPLNEERDIQAILSGAPRGNQLRHVLTGLAHNGQLLAFGYAIPFPLVIATRRYDEKFYRDISYSDAAQIGTGHMVINHLY